MVFLKEIERETLVYLIKGNNNTTKFRLISRYKNLRFSLEMKKFYFG